MNLYCVWFKGNSNWPKGLCYEGRDLFLTEVLWEARDFANELSEQIGVDEDLYVVMKFKEVDDND